MIANYHTHTYRCNHATGSEREYIEVAIKNNLKILGFSDHSPYPFDNGFNSSFRMKLDEAKDYFDTILQLKKEYSSKIEIHIGLEVEYYPKYFNKLLDFLKDYPCEYLILGQHFINNEIDENSYPSSRSSNEILNTYVNQVIQAIKTKKFLYIAHPDIASPNVDKAFYQKEMKRLCVVAKEYDIPLEINLLGVRNNRHYPNTLFWEVASEIGNKVILGIDAHQPSDIATSDDVKKALEIVGKYNLNLITKLNIN